MEQHVKHVKLAMRVPVAHGHITVGFRDAHTAHQEHIIHQQDKHRVLRVVLVISVPVVHIVHHAQQL